jgi:hypothetical protein
VAKDSLNAFSEGNAFVVGFENPFVLVAKQVNAPSPTLPRNDHADGLAGVLVYDAAFVTEINHLDAFTAPRLVEYYDPDPCLRYDDRMAVLSSRTMYASNAAGIPTTALAASRYAGVKVEASYDVLNTHRRPACPAPTSAEPVGGGLMPSDQSAASASLKSWVLSETAGLG